MMTPEMRAEAVQRQQGWARAQQLPVEVGQPLAQSLSPEDQQRYNEIRQRSQQAPDETAPSAVPVAPATQAAAPSSLGKDVQDRVDLYREAAFRFPQAYKDLMPHVVDLDKFNLEYKTKNLEISSKALGMISEFAASVEARPESERPAAYSQGRAMLIQMGIPNADQLPPVYNQQQNQAIGTRAQTMQQRVEADLRQQEIANTQFSNNTGRLVARTGEAAEIRMGQDITIQETPEGAVGVWKYPRPGQPATIPLMDPLTGKRLENKDAYKYKVGGVIPGTQQVYLIPEIAPPSRGTVGEQARPLTPSTGGGQVPAQTPQRIPPAYSGQGGTAGTTGTPAPGRPQEPPTAGATTTRTGAQAGTVVLLNSRPCVSP